MPLIALNRDDRDWIPALGELFFRVVDDGASLGFLEDVDEPQMRDYWEQVFDQLGRRHRLWLLHEGPEVLGTVQLALCGKPNGRHRAEVQKLMVHPEARRRGVAVQLMDTAEAAARDAGLRLLVLDTEAQSPAEGFYQTQGWQRTGEIPNFATSPGGAMHATAIYWKLLD